MDVFAEALVEPVFRGATMQKLMRMTERVGRNTAAVLITGETGTGKELIARAIHRHSLRCCKPWVDINCTTLPEHLVESELFGYEKGAFSGADSRKEGLFELAHKGTLFLDEIGEINPKVQVKLLRVLDGAPYYRLGGNTKVAVDVRVIAATNQDPETAVSEGRFRSDLYHRLAQFHLHVPPLRDRREDVLPIAEYYLRLHGPDQRLAPDAVAALEAHSWPGNVRELRNIVLKAATLCDSQEIHVADLELVAAAPVCSVDDAPAGRQLDEVERDTILVTLAASDGHQGVTAEKLGISRRTLSRKLKRYGSGSPQQGEAEPLGVLSPKQKNCFRAAVRTPVLIRNQRGEELACEIANVSIGGLGVLGLENPFTSTGALDLSFTLPGVPAQINVQGTLVWANVQKMAGIRFTQLTPETQRVLREWLIQKQNEEGWRALDSPS